MSHLTVSCEPPRTQKWPEGFNVFASSQQLRSSGREGLKNSWRDHIRRRKSAVKYLQWLTAARSLQGCKWLLAPAARMYSCSYLTQPGGAELLLDKVWMKTDVPKQSWFWHSPNILKVLIWTFSSSGCGFLNSSSSLEISNSQSKCCEWVFQLAGNAASAGWPCSGTSLKVRLPKVWSLTV